MQIAGADVWKGQWIVVVLDDGRFDQAFLAPSIEAASAQLPEATILAVDMPIGLPEAGQTRLADVAARNFIGPRWQSVFMTPCRDLLEAPTHAKANELARAEGWAGISAQAYALGPQILQVQPVAESDNRIYEVHPEVSFAAANGAPLPWSKSCWNGSALRRNILRDQGIVIPDDLGEAGAAGVADMLDAAIAAWSAARVAHGDAESHPPRADRIGAIWL
jgi:predicted RNase H-like nuclease